MTGKTFLHESKDFQVIRLLNVMYKDSTKVRDTQDTKTLQNLLKKRVNEHQEFSCYIDLIARVESWYQLYSPSPGRYFADQGLKFWTPIPLDERNIVHPVYVAVCSVINEATDIRLRDELSAKSTLPARIEPISYYVYRHILCGDIASSIELEGATLALLLFQVRSAALVETITDPVRFFDEFLSWGSVLSISGCHVAMCGLPRGDFDGFILFALQEKSLVSALLRSLQDASDPNTFFGRIAPILLYEGSIDTDFNTGNDNLKILKEISDNDRATLKTK